MISFFAFDFLFCVVVVFSDTKAHQAAVYNARFVVVVVFRRIDMEGGISVPLFTSLQREVRNGSAARLLNLVHSKRQRRCKPPTPLKDSH